MSASGKVYGLHAVEACLQRHGARVRRLWVQQGRADARIEALLTSAATLGLEVRRAPPEELSRLAGEGVHQGVLAEVDWPRPPTEDDLDDLVIQRGRELLLLVLDGVQDPHNLGACLRTAEAVGADAVIAPKDRAVGLTPVVRKVAAGAAESLPFIQVTNLARTIRGLQGAGVWVVGAAGESPSSLYGADLTGPLALVLGSEADGLRRLTRETCDLLVSIPMAGIVSSLNVSVAAGVCLFEARRQRGTAVGLA
ncbi:MAG: 23S rRNA (guanosine(2251)-2'-O)-methyltransferase RlmB [Steroidobacteraceae bacterium]